jgi:predicted lipoprotein with Yx(FWY)xxD motif
LTLLIATALIGSIVATVAVASASKTKLVLHNTKTHRYGTILVMGSGPFRGFTLYAFSLDKRNKDACQGIPACLTAWPPVTAPNGVAPGPGVKRSLIGTIRLKSGRVQVTYNGRPLYRYAGDTHPGETTFINLFQFQGTWPAVNAAGQDITGK